MRDLAAVTLAERRARRRPGAWVLLGAGLLLSLTFGYLIPYLLYASDSGGGGFTAGTTPEELLAGTLPGQLVTRAISALPIFSGALVLVLGALVTGGEYAAGTLKTLLTQGPRRGTVFAGQVLACVHRRRRRRGGPVRGLRRGCRHDRPRGGPRSGLAGRPRPAARLRHGLGRGRHVGHPGRRARRAAPIGSRSPSGLAWSGSSASRTCWTPVASTTLTALEPVRDLLPGVNAGSLILSVLPPASGELPPGVADTVSGAHGLVVVLAYAAVAAAALLVAGRRRDVA